MKKRMLMLVTLAVTALFLVSCSANIHNIGDGPQQGIKVKQRQWYVLFGLIPLNQVDTAAMADGADNYQIKTVQNVDDILINIITNYVTITSRTVEVTK